LTITHVRDLIPWLLFRPFRPFRSHRLVAIIHGLELDIALTLRVDEMEDGTSHGGKTSGGRVATATVDSRGHGREINSSYVAPVGRRNGTTQPERSPRKVPRPTFSWKNSNVAAPVIVLVHASSEVLRQI
jgi:hypothetical protein